MKDITIDRKDTPAKLNTEALVEELKAKLGTEEVAVSTYDDGAVVVVHVPDDVVAGKAIGAVKAHAPIRNDHEEAAHQADLAFDAKVRASLVRLGVLAA